MCFAGFAVVSKPGAGISSVSLPLRLGPRLLVSDWGTFDKPILRWRLRIWGNMAVEFGVVPLSMVVRSQPSMQALPDNASHTLLGWGPICCP